MEAYMEVPRPEDIVQCPFDKSHLVFYKRFQTHLKNCRKKYHGETFTCEYNARHVFLTDEELQQHLTRCRDKYLLEILKYMEQERQARRLGGRTDIPVYDAPRTFSSSEEWGIESSSALEPSPSSEQPRPWGSVSSTGSSRHTECDSSWGSGISTRRSSSSGRSLSTEEEGDEGFWGKKVQNGDSAWYDGQGTRPKTTQFQPVQKPHNTIAVPPQNGYQDLYNGRSWAEVVSQKSSGQQASRTSNYDHPYPCTAAGRGVDAGHQGRSKGGIGKADFSSDRKMTMPGMDGMTASDWTIGSRREDAVREENGLPEQTGAHIRTLSRSSRSPPPPAAAGTPTAEDVYRKDVPQTFRGANKLPELRKANMQPASSMNLTSKLRRTDALSSRGPDVELDSSQTVQNIAQRGINSPGQRHGVTTIDSGWLPLDAARGLGRASCHPVQHAGVGRGRMVPVGRGRMAPVGRGRKAPVGRGRMMSQPSCLTNPQSVNTNPTPNGRYSASALSRTASRFDAEDILVNGTERMTLRPLTKDSAQTENTCTEDNFTEDVCSRDGAADADCGQFMDGEIPDDSEWTEVKRKGKKSKRKN